MDDSGYISSLESSAMRPYQHSKLLTSEADRPRIKRGRAEEEIARLRASSYESPSKGRSYAYAPTSSSPLRQTGNNNNGQMLPPLTPAMKLKAPPKPPPSVSPSTNLRLHRQNIQSMVESPYRRVTALLPEADASLQLTPGFEVDNLWFDVDRKPDDSASQFDIFDDGATFQNFFQMTPTVAPNGSPTKRSVKKRLERSQSTGALTGTPTPYNAASASNFLKVPSTANSLALETPSKVFDGLPSSPSKLFLDLQSPTKPSSMPLINDENLDPWVSLGGLDTPNFLDADNDFSGFDMLAGFEKIGSTTSTSVGASMSANINLASASVPTTGTANIGGAAPTTASQPRATGRKSGLGRSLTTTF